MAKPLILCVADERYQIQWQFCLRSHRAYAAQHGYQYALISQPINKLNFKWSKIRYVLNYLEQGNDVLLIDADAAFTQTAPAIDEIAAGAGKCIMMANGFSGRPNSGVMYFKNTDVSRRFLSTLLQIRKSPFRPKPRVL